MSVIEASSVGVRTMVDGTLRLTVDIEPRHSQAAFALFGAPGTAMALAALKAKGGEPQAQPPLKEGPRRTTGPICQWLVMRCKELAFQQWAFDSLVLRDKSLPHEKWAFEGPSETDCVFRVRAVCGVDSRSEIDGNAKSEAWFEKHIRRPWLEHQRKAESRV